MSRRHFEHDVQQRLARNIRSCREWWGWTQQDLADSVGLSRCQVTNLEAGRGLTSVFRLIHLADLFQISLEDLLFVEQTGRPDLP